MTDIRITAKLMGIKDAQMKFKNIGTRISAITPQALEEAGRILRDASIENVYRLAKNPEISKGEGESITDPENWSINPIGGNEVEVSCNSKHALIVEHGGYGGIIMARAYGWRKIPVGQSHSADKRKTVYVDEVPLQQGLHYFQSAIDSPDVKSRMATAISNRLKREVF